MPLIKLINYITSLVSLVTAVQSSTKVQGRTLWPIGLGVQQGTREKSRVAEWRMCLRISGQHEMRVLGTRTGHSTR